MMSLNGQELSQWVEIKHWMHRPMRQRWIHYYVLFPEYMNLLQGRNHTSILDYGCGDGTLSLYLKEKFPDSDITAYDVVENMRNIARSNVNGINVPDTLHGLQFDVICLNMVLQDVDEPVKVLRSVRSSLSPSGMLIVSLPHPVYSLIEANHKTTRRERISEAEDVHDFMRYPLEETEKVYWSNGSENWTFLYNRTIQTYSEIFYQAGFSIISIREPLSIAEGGCEKDLFDIYSHIPGTMLFVCAVL